MALKELLTNLEQGLQSYPNHNTPSTSGGFGYGGTRIFDSKSFRQRDFEFGKGTAYDRPGQEFSREPLIGKNIAIPDPNSQPSAALGFIDSISDGLIRGGLATSISRSAQDVARISKFYLTSRGINFLIKQIGLQKSNPNIEAGSTSFEIFGLGFNLNRNTTFNAGLNLIAQAGVNASGVHFDRSGATPIWPEDQKYEKSVLSSLKPDTVGSLSNNNGVEGGNRLLTLHSSTGVGIGAVENRPDPTGPSGFNLFGINIGGSLGESISNVVTNIQNLIGIGPDQVGKLYEYNGGPNSLYGIGKTTIRRYTNTTGAHLTVDYMGLGYYIPNKHHNLIYTGENSNSRIRAYSSTPTPILGEGEYTIQPNSSDLAIEKFDGLKISDKTDYNSTDDKGNPLYVNISKDGVGNPFTKVDRTKINEVLNSASLQSIHSNFAVDRSDPSVNIGSVDNKLNGAFSFKYTDESGTSIDTDTPDLYITTPNDGTGNTLVHITSASLSNVKNSASLQEPLSPFSIINNGVNSKLLNTFSTGDNAVENLFINTPGDGTGTTLIHITSASLSDVKNSASLQEPLTPFSIINNGVDSKLLDRFSTGDNAVSNLFINTPGDGAGILLSHINNESLSNVQQSASLQLEISPYSIGPNGFGVNYKLLDTFSIGDNAVSNLFIPNNFSGIVDTRTTPEISKRSATDIYGTILNETPPAAQYVGLINAPINDIGEIGSNTDIFASSSYAKDIYQIQRWGEKGGITGLANELGVLTYDSLINIGVSNPNSREVVDFRKRKKDQGVTDIPYSNYSKTTVNNPSATFIREERVNTGNPGHLAQKKGFAYNVYDSRTIDKINALDVIRIKDNDFTSQAFRDLIRFRIEAVDTDNPDESDVMFFRAFLDDYSDNFNANWNEFTYNGRGESLYSYGGFKRDINFSFKIAAQSRHEMMPIYRKLNFLCAQTAPDYGSGTRMRGPYVKLTIGSLVDRTPGFINSVGLSWQKDYPWEINIDGPEQGGDKEMQVLPHVLDVSVKFTPIHNFLPQKSITKSPFLFKHERNNGMRKEEKWYTNGAAQSINEALPQGTRTRGLGQSLSNISNAGKITE